MFAGEVAISCTMVQTSLTWTRGHLRRGGIGQCAPFHTRCLFIDFLLSREGQKRYANKAFLHQRDAQS